MSSTGWQPGDVIVRREVSRGHPWAAIPVRVIADRPDLLALNVAEGAPFGFAEPPVGRHGWANRERWSGHRMLSLQRPGDAYAVFVFWRGEEREFAHWYLNLQDPFRRTRIGVDTYDHTLDLWSTDGAAWHWKDDETLDQRVAEGRFTSAEAAAIRAEARRLEAELGDGGRWWDDSWAAWEPDPGWEIPALDPAWTREPT